MPLDPDPEPKYEIVFVPKGQLRPWRCNSFSTRAVAEAELEKYKRQRSFNHLNPNVHDTLDTWCIVRIPPDINNEWGEICP